VAAKIVRLRLNLTRSLLEEFRRVKIVYLVRDPRATLNSRTAFGWCTKSRDCMEPKRLCDDIDRDLDAFWELSKVYPDRLMLVKYETLASEPLETFESIFHFSGLSFSPSVRETIRLHTSRNKKGAASTFRKSSEPIDRWTRKLGWLKIRRIQSVCSSVLERLEYHVL
jgi:Sulfotransferase domain